MPKTKIIKNISDSIVFRHFKKGDTKKIIELHKIALMETGAYASGPWNDDMKNIEKVYIKPGGCFVLIEKSSNIIAMGALKIINSKEAEIKRMRVEPAIQRKGYGQIILDYIISFAINNKIKRLILDTTELQIPAQEFYKKNNFTEYGRDKWNDISLILYERELFD